MVHLVNLNIWDVFLCSILNKTRSKEICHCTLFLIYILHNIPTFWEFLELVMNTSTALITEGGKSWPFVQSHPTLTNPWHHLEWTFPSGKVNIVKPAGLKASPFKMALSVICRMKDRDGTRRVEAHAQKASFVIWCNACVRPRELKAWKIHTYRHRSGCGYKTC